MRPKVIIATEGSFAIMTNGVGLVGRGEKILWRRAARLALLRWPASTAQSHARKKIVLSLRRDGCGTVAFGLLETLRGFISKGQQK